MKRMLALVLALMLMALLPVSLAEDPDAKIVLYASVPADWAYPCVWAWNDSGANAFSAWPGEQMEPDPANEGWYYLYLPADMESVILNANDGGVQTTEYRIDKQNAWLTVAEDGVAEVSFEALTTGEAPRIHRIFYRICTGGRQLGKTLRMGMAGPRRHQCLCRMAGPPHEGERKRLVLRPGPGLLQ